jgi:hypothetical protein
MSLLFALMLVLVCLLIWTRDTQMHKLTKQAHACKKVAAELHACNESLDECRGEVKSFEDGVKFTRLEADLKEANDQVALLAEQLLLHKAMLTSANEVADGYINPSRTYTGISREFGLLSQSGVWSQDDIALRQKLNDREAMIEDLRLKVQQRTADVNGLVAELMAAKYGGTRAARSKPASIMNWSGPQ